ncbi:MAG: alpha/beta hydrolase, partial [Gemmatimonadaceae bacterium]|nr:alpha/beta hydrolase [Gemmatimonadaceae bacterium]
VRQWDVLGHSWGGGIAMLAAARDLVATRRLVTVDAVGPTSAWMTPLHEAVLSRVTPEERAVLHDTHHALASPDAAVHAAHSRAGYRGWFADLAFASYFTPPEAGSETGAAIAAQLRRDGYDWRESLRALSTQTLVLHGERDALPSGVALELSALLPRAQHVLIPGAGHMPFWEAPERFFAVVESFLATPATSPPRRA